MTALIIEDDDIKLGRLRSFIGTVAPNEKVEWARSYKTGLKALVSSAWSVVILDMTLPTFDIQRGSDGGRPLSLGGRELLRQMKRRGHVYPTVVVTGFDTFGFGREAVTLQQLDDQLSHEFDEFYLGAVYFSATTDDWKERLKGLIQAPLSRTEEL